MDKLFIKSKLKTASKCRNIHLTVSKYTLSILQNLILNHVPSLWPCDTISRNLAIQGEKKVFFKLCAMIIANSVIRVTRDKFTM